MNIQLSNENTNSHMIDNINQHIAIGKASPKTQRTVVDRICTFNDMGTSEFQSGHLDSSEIFFSRAASQLGIDLKQKTLSPEDKDAHMGNSSENDRLINPSRYDEGMHVYHTPLRLPGNSQQEGSRPITAAVVAFNMAQVQIVQNKITQAESWLHQALYWTKAHDRFSNVLIVKILHCLGYCSYISGKGDMGMVYFQQALATGQHFKIGNQYIAASFNCIGVLQFSMDDVSTIDKSLVSFEQSLQLYQSCAHKADPLALATVHNNIGRLHYLRSHFTRALESYQQSLEVRRRHLGDKSIDVAATLYNTAQAYQQLGRYEESLKHYEAFLETAKCVFGEDSKDVALALKGVAEIHQERGTYDSALDFFRQALRAQTVAEGRFTSDVATLLNKIGNLCYEMTDYKAAMAAYTEGLKIECGILPSNHPHTIITQLNIAHIHKQMGEFQEALAAYERVLNMQVEEFGSNSVVLAETISFIALMQYHLGDYASALEAYQFALQIHREHSDDTNDHPSIASTLNSIGLVFFKQKAYDLANMCFTESLRIRTKLLGPDHRDVAILWYNLATVYFERGEEETAIEMYKETLRVERLHLGVDHPDVALTLRHLGQVHQQLGKLEESVKYYLQVIALERKRDVTDRVAMSKALNLLGNVYLQLDRVPEMMKCYVAATRLNEAEGASGSQRLVISGYTLYSLHKTNPPAAPVA